MPKPELFLNEASFTGEYPSHTGYRPLFWTHFGGPGGGYLENVTGVSIYYSRKGLYSLEFHYDTTYDLAGTLRLGRCASTDLKIRHFPIDGAGGEIIESVEVTLVRYDTEKAYGFLQHGIPSSVKVRYSSLLKRNVVVLVGVVVFVLT